MHTYVSSYEFSRLSSISPSPTRKGDVARDAQIVAVALSEPGAESEGAFTLIDVLNQEEGDVDLIVASISFDDGTQTRAERGRDDYFARAFKERLYLRRRPPALFPTGNLHPDGIIDRLAVPARFEGTITIGSAALASDGRMVRRSEGSRYDRRRARLHWHGGWRPVERFAEWVTSMPS